MTLSFGKIEFDRDSTKIRDTEIKISFNRILINISCTATTVTTGEGFLKTAYINIDMVVRTKM